MEKVFSMFDFSISYAMLLGLGIVVLIVFSISIVKIRNRSDHNKTSVSNNNSQGGDNLIAGSSNSQVVGDNNQVTIVQATSPIANDNSKCRNITLEDIKAKIRILFIDDKDDFRIVDMLKHNGYNVDYVSDIYDIDDAKLKYADIVFVDINGVGVTMGFKNQGVGLCGAIRDYYGDSKKLILYSGETLGNIFDADVKKVDATLPKDSDLYQFTSYISQYGKDLLKTTHRL